LGAAKAKRLSCLGASTGPIGSRCSNEHKRAGHLNREDSGPLDQLEASWPVDQLVCWPHLSQAEGALLINWQAMKWLAKWLANWAGQLQIGARAARVAAHLCTWRLVELAGRLQTVGGGRARNWPLNAISCRVHFALLILHFSSSALSKQRAFQTSELLSAQTVRRRQSAGDSLPQTVCRTQSADSLPHTIRRQSAPADGCCLRVLLRAPARLLAKSSGPLNGQLALIERSPSSSPKQQRGQPNSLDRRQPAGPSGCPSRQPPGQRSPIAMHCDRVR